jgi:effector-binding domain-containing protein
MKYMRLLLMLVLTCYYVTGIEAQNMYNVVDSIGYKQGMWIEFKIPFGMVTEYVGIKIPDIDSEYYYLTKDRDRKYFPIIECVGKYENGHKTGVWYEYYGNDTIKSRVLYDAGIPTGYCKTFWGTGTLKEEFTINSSDSVPYKAYNLNGELIIEKTIPKDRVIKSIYEN